MQVQGLEFQVRLGLDVGPQGHQVVVPIGLHPMARVVEKTHVPGPQALCKGLHRLGHRPLVGQVPVQGHLKAQGPEIGRHPLGVLDGIGKPALVHRIGGIPDHQGDPLSGRRAAQYPQTQQSGADPDHPFHSFLPHSTLIREKHAQEFLMSTTIREYFPTFEDPRIDRTMGEAV